MFNKTFILIAFCALCFGNANAQDETADLMDRKQLVQFEDSLIMAADSMYNAYMPADRVVYTERFIKQLIRALKVPNSYKYPFSNLDTVINVVYPEGKEFRIFNWITQPTEIGFRYYGAIQLDDEDLRLYPMFDYSNELKNGAEDSILRGGKWYGTLIYKIITKNVDGEPVYTLLGKNINNPASNKKIMDPMVLTDKGPVFGMPIFDLGGGIIANRFILEYKKQVNVSLNWDNDMNAIFFDRLVSQVNDPNRKYTFVPSGEYDGFKWSKGKWEKVNDLIPIEVRENGQAPTPQPLNKTDK